jgi:predicted transcriptional regulator
VPTCALGDRLGEVRERVRSAGWNACVVVNEHSVVLGLLREKELEGDADLPIERAMRPGPSTFRTYVPIAEMAEYMTKHDLVNAPITTADGKLVGLLLREDAQRSASGIQRPKGNER